MKRFFLSMLLIYTVGSFGQVAITNDASPPNPSAMLDIKSTTRGLLVPRMTQAQRNAIASPATGLMIYQTDLTAGYYFNFGIPADPSWQKMSADNWGTQTVAVNPSYFAGDGTSAAPLSLTSMGASAGQVLKWNGTLWDNASDNTGPWAETENPAAVSYWGSKLVGIGTNYPRRKLTIAEAGTSCYLSIHNLTTGFDETDGMHIGMQGNAGWITTYEAANLYIGSGSMGSLVITPTGNVGIGNSSPAYDLDISGQLNLNRGVASGIALRTTGDETIWYNGTYFSWGYAADYNFFGNKLKIGGNGSIAPAYTLYVDGTVAKSSAGTAWVVSSDARLKNVLGNYNKGLSEILGLQPVRFTYLPNNPRQLNTTDQQIGFVAQDVQKIFPEAVLQANDGYLDFDIHALNVAVINAIRELKLENDRLKARVEQLEKFQKSQANH